MAGWEYQVDVPAQFGGELTAFKLQNYLTQRGNEGWELVTILFDGKWLVFKRPGAKLLDLM